MKTTLIIYTMNEIDGMRVVMPRIKPEWADEIIVIDGGSTDGTIEYCKEHGITVYRQEGFSWAGAYYEGHKRATGDIIVDFSPDGNSLPEAIPWLVEEVKKGNDMVIASRYTQGARSDDDSLITAFGNWMFTTMINILFRGRLTDTLVLFRAYRKSLLRELLLDKELVHAFTPQSCIRCLKLKKKVTEIPAVEPKRVGGVRKMQIFGCGWMALEIIWREYFDRDLEVRVKREQQS